MLKEGQQYTMNQKYSKKKLHWDWRRCGKGEKTFREDFQENH